MCDTSERPEGVEAGTVKLVGTDVQAIVSEVNVLIDDSLSYMRMANASNPYGDGHAADNIAAVILGICVHYPRHSTNKDS